MAIQIKELVIGLSATDFIDYLNWNFDQILLNGGGPQGPIGTIGLTGPQGAVGSPGNITYTSDLDVSTISNPSDGDLFIVGDANNISSIIYYPYPTPYTINPTLNPNGDIFIYDATNSVWVFTGTNIKGEQGQIGLTGDTVFEKFGTSPLVAGNNLNNVNLFKIFLSDSNYVDPTNKINAPLLILGSTDFTDGVNSYSLLNAESVTDSNLSHLFYSLGRSTGSPSFTDRDASSIVRFFTGPPKHATINPNNSIKDSFYIELNRSYGGSQNSRDRFQTNIGVGDANSQNKIDVKVGSNVNISFRKNLTTVDKDIQFNKIATTFDNVIFNNPAPFNFIFENNLSSTFTNHITLLPTLFSLNFNSYDTTFNLDSSNIILNSFDDFSSSSYANTANISLIGDNTNTANITITNNSGVDSSGNININKGFIKAFSDTTFANSYHFLGLGNTLGTSKGLTVTPFFGSTLTNINTDLLLTSGVTASITNTTINLGTSTTSDVNIAIDGTQIIKIGDSSTAGVADQTIEIATNDYTTSFFYYGPTSLQSNSINLNAEKIYIRVPKFTLETAKPMKVVTNNDDGRIVSGDIDLTSEVSGVLPIVNGGTNTNTISAGVVTSNGTSLGSSIGASNAIVKWNSVGNNIGASSIIENAYSEQIFIKYLEYNTLDVDFTVQSRMHDSVDSFTFNVGDTYHYKPYNLYIDNMNIYLAGLTGFFNLINLNFPTTSNPLISPTFDGIFGLNGSLGYPIGWIHLPNLFMADTAQVNKLKNTTFKINVGVNLTNPAKYPNNDIKLPIVYFKSGTIVSQTGFTEIPINYLRLVTEEYSNKDLITNYEAGRGGYSIELKLVTSTHSSGYEFMIVGGSGHITT